MFLHLILWSLLAFSQDQNTSSYVEELVAKAREKNLANEQQWLNLLHYKRNLFGLKRSQVANPQFFLSSKGYKDPWSELEATIRAFFVYEGEGGETKNLAQCKYPARFRWIDKQLGLDRSRIRILKCENFMRFFTGADAKSVTIVFSSYFLNNPSSMFGHTFMRLNKKGSGKSEERYELLDYGINFAASANVSNPVLYAIYGLGGFFKGEFTSLPYYYKVREYNDFDTRDLWEYEIKLTQEQVDMLAAHLWEMGSAYFNYFYLTQNCSFHLFTVIDAAAPELALSDRTRLYVIPAETVKVLYEVPGLVTQVSYRPSLRTVFDHRVEKLSGEERKVLYDVVHNRDTSVVTQLATPRDRAEVLDAALDHADYSLAHPLLAKEKDAVDWKQSLLIARSKEGVISEKVHIPPSDAVAPHKGHGSARFMLSQGVADSQSQFTHIGYRFALHDLNDRFIGYPEFAHIDFLSFEARFTHQSRKFEMEEFSLINITSLNDFTTFHQKPSWHARLGGTRIRDRGCDHCFAWMGEAGGGLARKILSNPSVTPYLFGSGEADLHGEMYGGAIRLGVGPRAGLRVAPSDHFVMLADVSYRYYFPNNRFWGFREQFTARYSFDENFGINLKLQRVPEASEGMLGVVYVH